MTGLPWMVYAGTSSMLYSCVSIGTAAHLMATDALERYSAKSRRSGAFVCLAATLACFPRLTLALLFPGQTLTKKSAFA